MPGQRVQRGGRRSTRRGCRGSTLRPDATGLAAYEVLSPDTNLKPGRYQLRIAANVGSLSTSGSLYDDVDVPDFVVSAGVVSGLILSASPGPSWRHFDTLETILPVVPTTRRIFTARQSGLGLCTRVPGRQGVTGRGRATGGCGTREA